MKKYRRLQTLLAALLAGTFVLGMVSAVRPSGEIFPFASWFLFSLVPQQVTSYDILVKSWGGRTFDPPKPLIEVEGLVYSPRSSVIYQLVQRYGQTLDSGATTEADHAWQLLRSKFTSAEPVTFEVVKRTYNPLDRARGGTIEQIRIAPAESAPAQPQTRKKGER